MGIHTQMHVLLIIYSSRIGFLTYDNMFITQFYVHSGKFLTEADVEARVDEMEATRNKMLERLEYQLEQQEAMHKIHDRDMKH